MIAAIMAMVPATAFAQECAANASHTETKQVQGSKYLFSFEIDSQDCARGCKGDVKFSVRYAKSKDGNQQGEVPQTVGFSIPTGGNQVNVSAPATVGTGDENEILDVSIDEINCATS